MTGENVDIASHETGIGETQPALRSTAATQAPMPGVEEIARATAIRITDAILDHVYVDGENVSASVLNPAAEIIADILKKERGLRKLAEDWDAYGVEQEMRMLDWRDRALAAEAALTEIARQDEIEIALDPDWPRRIASAALEQIAAPGAAMEAP